MNYDSSRRGSTTPNVAPNAIPSAPPLPAPRPLQRARDAATRFFGYHSRPASPQGSPEEERYATAGRARYASLSAFQNATGSHRTGLEINTLSINEKGTHALLGGREIFKTVRVVDGTCVEDLNLRSAIRSTPTQASGKARQVYSIDIADVAWAKGDCGDYVAAATSSGKIILYDLGHAGLQAAQLHEHFRQVHKVTFNPHRGSLLLSGSQDGTVRLWDVRDVRQASTLQSKRKYSGQSDGVRDVKWSPTEAVDFAFGTDSGWIQRWDMRNLKTAKVKIPAHSETCNAIDWHPDGKHIASASSDKTVRVWDFSSGRRQQKASWEIKTPYRVSNARWRPPCESSLPADRGARQSTQLVTAYDQEHPVLHIWDLRRPALPFRELTPYASAPTDLLWHSQDLLWTVGKEGVFLQSDVHYTQKAIDKRNLQAFATSSQGDINFATQKRRQNHLLPQRQTLPIMASQSSSRSHNPERALLSRSWTDDGLDESFLKKPTPKRGGKYSAVNTRIPSIATSSLNSITFTAIKRLDEVLNEQDSLKPQQLVWHGHIPTAPDPKIFPFLAQNYEIDLDAILNAHVDDFVPLFEKLLIHNAQCAAAAGLYRTAQTWKIASFLMTSHLKKRIEFKTKQRQEDKPRLVTPAEQCMLVRIARKLMREQSRSPILTSASLKPISAITQQLAPSEVASEQRTPPVLAHSDDETAPPQDLSTLPDPAKGESLVLPPSISTVLSQADDAPASSTQTSVQLTTSNLSGLQKLERGANGIDKAAMVRRWSVQPKEPLNLDPVDSHGIKIQSPKLQRHASNESFTFLDGSATSRDPSFPSSLGSTDAGPMQMVAERPSRSTEKPKEDESSGIEAQDFDVRSIKALPARPEPVRHAQEKPLSPTYASRNKNVSADSPPSQPETIPPYLPEDDDIDIEETGPFATVEMLRELISYYASKGEAQMAAHLILLLAPLLPRTHPLPVSEAAATVAVYTEYFAGAGYTQDQIESIFDRHFQSVVSSGLQPLQIEAIISTYHEQLISRRLFHEAAILRKLSYPMYPSVYEEAEHDDSVHIRCGECGKPMVSGMEKLRCESCGTKQAACPICWLDESPYEEDDVSSKKKPRLLSKCLLCGHGGHAACLRAWYEEGDGACPTEWCLCDCVAGTWRDEKLKLAEQKRQAKGHGRVKSDEWGVEESSAVERARAELGAKGAKGLGLDLTTA